MNATRQAPTHRRRNRRGFTLTEMLVVIVILLIMLGIGVTVGVSLIQDQEVKLTKQTLRQCDLIAAEFVARTGSPPDVDNIADFVAVTSVDLQSMYKSFDPDVYKSGKIFDAWGKEIQYSKDGKANLYAKQSHTSYYFASAGPDDKEGDVTANLSSDNRKRAQDNLYSFRIGE